MSQDKASSHRPHSLGRNIGSGDSLTIQLHLHHASQPPQQFESGRSQHQLTLEAVLAMSLQQLEKLQNRVAEMEVSNYGLLTRIYGRFPPDRRPFPLIITSRNSDPSFPITGSSPHRELVFKQYKNMSAISLDPTRCVEMIEPPTARGAKALQDYQLQLLVLAEKRKAQMKRKYADQEVPTAPRAEPDSVREMQSKCGVFDLRPSLQNHRPGSDALTEYQQQLKLLGEQNKKRLLQARRDAELALRRDVVENREQRDRGSLPLRPLTLPDE
jgi:hypothetical protein